MKKEKKDSKILTQFGNERERKHSEKFNGILYE